jgi:hypothetical protein
MIYLLNTLVVPVDFDTVDEVNVKLRRISVDEARELLRREPFVSAIGHEGSAKVLSELLNTEIPMNRVSVFMQSGDKGLHFFLKRRLPEGVVLTAEELSKLEYWLVLSEVE